MSTNSTIPGYVFTCCAEDFGLMVVSVFVALEADVDLGGSFRRHLNEGDILNDVGEQPLAFTVRRIWICPKLTEVYRHRDQPLADIW